MANRPAHDAVVVGAGPNGLAAATTLAQAGLSVLVLEAQSTPGGGARSAELTEPGFVHDVCSAVHPLGIASPYLSSLPLDHHGLEWVHPEVDLAHPFDDGGAAALVRSIDESGASMDDARRWRRLLGGVVEHWDAVADQILGPPLRVPRDPIALGAFGRRAMLAATTLAYRDLRTRPAQAVFAGLAAHAITRLDRPLSAAVGVVLGASVHVQGWPVARGGSQRITDALVSLLGELGGTVECDRVVRSLDDLPPSRLVLFDVNPRQLVAIAGHRLSGRMRRRLLRYRHGPGSFKVDYTLSGPVPWTAEAPRRAGTVHLGGTLEEIAGAERAVAAGHLPDRPFVIVAQQSVVDPTRAPSGQHTLWAYCHVPAGCTEDMTTRIEAQLERFAPGFREVVRTRAVAGPVEMAAANANYVGGDIAGGSASGLQMVFRPGIALDPYATGDPSLFLCSASTPPGAGVHGMSGHHAARSALRSLGHSGPSIS